MEDKIKVLANTIVNHSIKVEKGENVKILMEIMEPISLVKELIKLIKEKDANVSVTITDPSIDALCNKDASSKKIELLRKQEELDVNNYDSFIRIYCNQGDFNNSIVSNETAKEIGSSLKKYRDIRANERKWVLLQYPSIVDSQKSGMNYDEFKDFSFEAMCYDYEQMAEDTINWAKYQAGESYKNFQKTRINSDKYKKSHRMNYETADSYMNDYFASKAGFNKFLDDEDIKGSLQAEIERTAKTDPNMTLDDFITEEFGVDGVQGLANELQIDIDYVRQYFKDLGFAE